MGDTKRVRPLKFLVFKQQLACTRCRDPFAELTVTVRLKQVEIEYRCKHCWPDTISHARARARLVDIIKLLIDLEHSQLMATQTIVAAMDSVATKVWAKRLQREALRPSVWPIIIGKKPRKRPKAKSAVPRRR